MPPAIMKNPVRKEYIPIGFVRSSMEMPTVSKKPPCANPAGSVPAVSTMP
jgi:hypothetical protein